MKRIISLIVISIVSVPAALFAQHPGCWNGFGFHRFFPGGFIMPILLIVLAALAVYFFIKSGKSGYSKDPVAILKERYARGEITKEQFEDMKKTIL